MLYDYGGPIFRHISSKLAQNELVDVDGSSLIPPWEEYEKLRPGTLVIATISLHVYVMKVKDRDGNDTGKDRRVCLSIPTLITSVKLVDYRVINFGATRCVSSIHRRKMSRLESYFGALMMRVVVLSTQR